MQTGLCFQKVVSSCDGQLNTEGERPSCVDRLFGNYQTFLSIGLLGALRLEYTSFQLVVFKSVHA